MQPFKDYFSITAGLYARARPLYPDRLFCHLAAVTEEALLAWDCATGSGQAVRGLVPYFVRVVGSDASLSQIKNAPTYDSVHYVVAQAEASGLRSASVDLITVAQALHWLELDAFFQEADRVLRRGGVLAAWCYGLLSVSSSVANARIANLYYGTLKAFWPPERFHVDQGYCSIDLPYPTLPTPRLEMRAEWTARQLFCYLRSWSAVQNYHQALGHDPIDDIEKSLAGHLRPVNHIEWPLYLLLTRKP